MPIAEDSFEQKEAYLNRVSLLSSMLENFFIDCNIVVLDYVKVFSSNGYLSFLNDICYDDIIIADMQRLNAMSYTYEQYQGGLVHGLTMF